MMWDNKKLRKKKKEKKIQGRSVAGDVSSSFEIERGVS
jgi:hypothetical protein